MLNEHQKPENLAGLAATEDAPAVAVPAKDTKPTRKLPYAKCSAKNQFKILQVAGTLSSKNQKALAVKDIADVMGTHQNTVSACNPFLVDIGLMTKNGHKFIPSMEVVSYAERLQWDKSDAGQKLAPIIENTWFSEHLKPRLQIKPHSENEVVSLLADVSGASPKYKAQLVMLVEYLELAGLIVKESGTISWVSSGDPEIKDSKPKDEGEQPEKISENHLDTSNYRVVDVGLIDTDISAKILLPKGMSMDDWETYMGVYNIYIKKYIKKDLGDEYKDFMDNHN